MTKKDYILIAGVLSEKRENAYSREMVMLDEIAEMFCEVLQEENSRFDPSRFLKACGIVECGLLDPESEVCDLENCNHPLLK